MILLFDLDGVITGEHVYWESAAQALAMFFGAIIGTPSIPVSLITDVKALAINSNWDLAYVLACCEVLRRSQSDPRAALCVLGRGDHEPFEWLASNQDHPNKSKHASELQEVLRRFSTWRGVDLLCELGAETNRSIGSLDQSFAYKGTKYTQIHGICQAVHDARLADGSGFPSERPAVELGQMRETFEMFHAGGLIMGIATGRTHREAINAVSQFGLLQFFQANRIVCYDDVVATEHMLLARDGVTTSLTKPHPFSLLRAAHPDVSAEDLAAQWFPSMLDVCYVGDTVSDVLAAKAAGAFSVGVLTGVPNDFDLRERRKQELLLAGCDCVIPSLLQIPQALPHVFRTS